MRQNPNGFGQDLASHLRPVLAWVALIALAACGGGGPADPDGGGEEDPGSASAYEAAAAIFAQDTDAIATLPETDAARMPTGSATYTGSAALTLELSHNSFTGAYADMVLESDFDGGMVTGNLTNIVEQQAGAVDGQVEIETGTISGAEIAAEARGQITLPTQSVDLVLDLTGTFLGDPASAIDGTLTGTTSVDGTFEGTAAGLFSIAR